MKNKKIKMTVQYSDARKEYLETAEWRDGIITSGYGTNEILSHDGAWLLETVALGGWFYLDRDLKILEKNTGGFKQVWFEEMS